MSLSKSETCGCRLMTPGAPPKATRKVRRCAPPAGVCCSATRCVFVPELRFPSVVAHTFCVSPLPMLDGGSVLEYAGMVFPFDVEWLLLDALEMAGDPAVGSPAFLVPGFFLFCGADDLLLREWCRPRVAVGHGVH